MSFELCRLSPTLTPTPTPAENSVPDAAAKSSTEAATASGSRAPQGLPTTPASSTIWCFFGKEDGFFKKQENFLLMTKKIASYIQLHKYRIFPHEKINTINRVS